VGLRSDFDELKAAGCEILSPSSVDFVAEADGFVLAERDRGRPPEAIEREHLAALEHADFVWLHAPAGYLGPSGALEVGVAHTLGIPIMARHAPSEVPFQQFVIQVSGPHEAANRAGTSGIHTPARPLNVLQEYYGRMADVRGFAGESPQDTLLLLVEEVGELAQAVRKSLGIARASDASHDPANELADVQLYVLHLANVMNLDLAAAVAAKERVNDARYGERAA
jgi:NTP pyrophosphatase (non-canonical NTP hydrolase)